MAKELSKEAKEEAAKAAAALKVAEAKEKKLGKKIDIEKKGRVRECRESDLAYFERLQWKKVKTASDSTAAEKAAAKAEKAAEKAAAKVVADEKKAADKAAKEAADSK